MTLDTTELRRLHGAATQGEWRAEIRDNRLLAFVGTIPGDRPTPFISADGNPKQRDDNTVAIVALHNAAPALLDGFDLMRDALTDIVENSADIGAVDTARAALAALVAMMGEG